MIRLKDDNFLKWHYQLESVMEGYDLFGHFDGSSIAPPKFAILDEEGATSEITATYMDWVKIDKALLSCLITTLSNDAIECVIGCKTAHDAWMNLTDPYAIVYRASINHLKIELHTAHKGSDSIEKFLLCLKHIRNHLAVTRVSVSDDDMMIAALNGLHFEYDMIKTILVALDTSLSFKDFCNQLLAAEQAAEACMLSSHAPMVGMLSQSSPSISSHALSGSSHGDVVETNSLVLDILVMVFKASFKFLLRLVVVLFLSVKYVASEGDGALDYFHRSNYIYQGSLPPASLTAMTAQTFFSPDAVLIVDSGASHHMVPHMTIMDFCFTLHLFRSSESGKWGRTKSPIRFSSKAKVIMAYASSSSFQPLDGSFLVFSDQQMQVVISPIDHASSGSLSSLSSSQNIHPMTTMSKFGLSQNKFFEDYQCFTSIHDSTTLDVPSTFRAASFSPAWIKAIEEEIYALTM
ncbi:unnamed protein product [Prunus armeniaca]